MNLRYIIIRNQTHFGFGCEADIHIAVFEITGNTILSVFPFLCQRYIPLLCQPFDFLQHRYRRIGTFFLISIAGNTCTDILRISGIQTILRSDIQTGGGRNHHQYHSQQNTDGGQTRPISFHPVSHGRNGNKMLRFVIIIFIFLQNTAEKYRAGNKQQVSGNNNHNHRHKKPYQCGHGLFDRDRERIGTSKNHSPGNSQNPVCLRRLFPDIFAPNQLHGTSKPYLTKRIKKQEKKNRTKQQHRISYRFHRNCKLITDFSSNGIDKPKLRQL